MRAESSNQLQSHGKQQPRLFCNFQGNQVYERNAERTNIASGRETDYSLRLPERMSPRDESDSLFVIHGHPAEGGTDVVRGVKGVAIASGALRIHIDEAHLHGPQWFFEPFPRGLLGRMSVVVEPLSLRPPVDPIVGGVDVGPAEAEPEGLEAHILHGDIGRQDHEVGPRDLSPPFLLDWP